MNRPSSPVQRRATDCGWYSDERGTVCNTPYGDMADVLHSDAAAWVLRQYGVVVAAGNLFTADAELRADLDAYVASGGTFVQSNDGGRSDAANISGGDVRLFSVQVDETGLRILPRENPPDRPTGRLLALRGISDLREEILCRPTFFEHFEGVKVAWTYFLNRDSEQLKRDRPWLERRQLRMVVDFTPGLNHFPDLTLLDLLPASYADSVARRDDVLAKMKLAGATNAVIATHMTPEFGATPEQVEASFQRGLRDLCRRARECGITLYLQNRTERWRGSVPESLRLIEDLGADNLRFALNTSCAEIRDAVRQAGDRLGLVLASAPGRSLPEMQRPIAEGGVDLTVLKALQVPVVLDGEHAGPDDVFRDLQAVWGGANCSSTAMKLTNWIAVLITAANLGAAARGADMTNAAPAIAAAADHGIAAFIFDWYDYDDGPFLDRTVNGMKYLEAVRDVFGTGRGIVQPSKN